ncbi:MAG: hypothetical protein LBB49_00655 [Gracilibacteraceae bacterium]|jgi:cytoskeletal protein CcmA (bactofilin family)|nr:hypothetical protein [Gracilibacteraceae bacterium]
MTQEAMKPHDIRIIGDSSIGTGPFGLVRVVGEANAREDMTCRELRVTGTVKAEQNLTCHNARIVGEVEIRGDCTMQSANITGNVRVGGNCTIQDASVTGEVKVAGDWQSATANVWGCLNVKGQCASEQIKVRGSLDVKGLLNFDQAEIVSGHPSKIQELGGRQIIVRKPKMPWKLWNNPFRTVILEAQSIEADDIDIDYTTAAEVRGTRVKIGKHCSIGKIEYSESLTVEEGAEIGASSQHSHE